MILKYQSGEEIKDGDHVLFHGQPGEIEFVASEEGHSFVREYGPGVMVAEPVSGHSFITANALTTYEDLIFLSRADAPSSENSPNVQHVLLKYDGPVAKTTSRQVESWKIIVGMALLGLIVAGACYAYAAFYDYSKPMNFFKVVLGIASLILCPPQFVMLVCIDCEVIGWNGFIMYSIFGVLNAVLYGLIGAIVAAFRKNATK